jgi:hypothetical protein
MGTHIKIWEDGGMIYLLPFAWIQVNNEEQSSWALQIPMRKAPTPLIYLHITSQTSRLSWSHKQNHLMREAQQQQSQNFSWSKLCFLMHVL